MAKINFIVPFKPRRPAGGFRIIYEYANRLANLGYDIHITYPIKIPYVRYPLPYIVRYILSNWIERFNTNKWFDFDKRITMSYIPEIKEKYVEDADIVIGTWWSVVSEIAKFGPIKGEKINLIQGYETWLGHIDLLHQSYNLAGFTNIVVASYLEKLVKQYSQNNLVVINNAVDGKTFYIKNPIDKRNPQTVAMTYSEQQIKGSSYGIEALKLVKQKYSDLKAELFGICPQPQDLPQWITYHRNPSNLPDIYNRNAIFISNSLTEGFPLTPAEALFCGCALICTDIEGHREYAIDNDTAILVRTKDSGQMAEQIIILLEDNNKRIALAQKGNSHIQRYNWDNAVQKMQKVINSLSSIHNLIHLDKPKTHQ